MNHNEFQDFYAPWSKFFFFFQHVQWDIETVYIISTNMKIKPTYQVQKCKNDRSTFLFKKNLFVILIPIFTLDFLVQLSFYTNLVMLFCWRWDVVSSGIGGGYGKSLL